ncbi:ankyrin repeat-containing domain protein [Russula dissimulans]|nr:ankyrin repeat-containing domain protein [Russula dissimulans]
MKDLFDPTKPHFRAWIWIHDVEWVKLTDQIKEHPSPPRATPLYYAALCGFNELVEHLMDAHGEDVNAHFSSTLHGTALQAASRNGHVDTARLLLDCGANVNGAAQHRSSPLSAAYRSNHPKVLKLLLEHGANVEDRRGISLGSALDDASFNGKVEMVDLLLRHNADVNARGYFDQVPLALTSHRGYVEIARLLLEHGSPVDPQSRSCNTPLFTAAEQGHLEFVRLLIGHGADVRLRGEGDRTPFQAAIAGGHHKIAQLLLEHGAD